jgi:hypothetical protein
MIDLATRTRLEVEFCSKLDYVIDHLVREDFPAQEVETFINVVRYFLKYEDIREYVVSALHDKAKELSKLFLVIDRGLFFSFRKFVGILVSLDDPEVIEMLETNFAKEKNLENFFILIEEELKQGKSSANCEKLFISLMTLHNYELQTVDQFLAATQRDRVYLVHKLIENKSFSALRKFVEEVGQRDVLGLKTIVPAFIEKYDDKINSNYMEMIRIVVTYDSSFTDELLSVSKWDLRFLFEKYILSSSTGNQPLLKNYCDYLLDRNKEQFLDFEKRFLESAEGFDIVRYSTNVPFSSKRLILRRLVEGKEEQHLVEFIKKFPEYQNLLPML